MNPCPIKRKNALDCTIDFIGSYIRQNHLKEGCPLPSEIVLSEKLGVGRNIVREALRHYRTLGMVDSKSKIGATVKRLFPENPYKSYLPFFVSQPGMLTKITEARIVIETGATDLMVANATSEQITRLEQYIVEIEQAPDVVKRFDGDCRFHSELLRCAANPFIDNMIPLIVDFFRTVAKGNHDAPEAYATYANIYREHREMVACLIQRKATRLAELLRIHHVANLKLAACQEKK